MGILVIDRTEEALDFTNLTALAVGGVMSKEGHASYKREVTRMKRLRDG